jgi:hypothetical protein
MTVGFEHITEVEMNLLISCPTLGRYLGVDRASCGLSRIINNHVCFAWRGGKKVSGRFSYDSITTLCMKV